MKKCSNKKCHELNPQLLDMFTKLKSSKDGFGPWCKTCRRNYSKNNKERSVINARKWAERNPGKRENNWFKWRYGITIDDRQKIYDIQEGKCANEGCRESIMLRAGPNGAHVDHCHITGVVRGLLCRYCNQALGMIKENVSVALGLATYIKTHCELHKKKTA